MPIGPALAVTKRPRGAAPGNGGVAVNAQICGFGSGFLRRGCRRDAITDCVYCGRRFCGEHGERAEDYMDVCAGKRCQEKLHDVREHAQWRRRVSEANRVSVCAVEGCVERLRHQCSRCRLLFCPEHIREREIADHSVQPPAKVLAAVCTHCLARRKLWD